jgi:addiction module HigA family antidote
MTRAPTHPGAILREDVFPELGVSITEAARDLGVSRQTLHRVLQEKTAVTPEMAARLGKYCGNGAGLWLRLQVAFDLWRTEQDLQKELARIPDRSQAA